MSTYAELSNQLDEILSKLQGGGLDIDDAIKDYEKAQKIITQMEKHLKNAEVTIKKLNLSLPE